MNLGNFVSGMVAGGMLVWGSQTYHVLRTDQGIQLIPKMQPSFAETYLDVRQFGISDWARHKTVAAAVVSAGKQDVFTQHAAETVTQGVGDLVREWNRLLPGQQ